MSKNSRRKHSETLRPCPRRRSGFTLIEVILVLVILVIISSMASITYFSIMRTANRNAVEAQIGLFDQALELYRINLKEFPTTEQKLQALREPPADLEDEDQWNGPYLNKEIPLDPWGNEYQYASPGSHNGDYDIWSWGPDGQDGTEDDIGNWEEE